MDPPGPGGRPQPVVLRVYSDHAITGVEINPPAMAALSMIPFPLSVCSSAMACTLRGREHPFGRRAVEQLYRWCRKCGGDVENKSNIFEACMVDGKQLWSQARELVGGYSADFPLFVEGLLEYMNLIHLLDWNRLILRY